MAIPRATAAFKKKEGVLTLTDDRKTIIWTPQSSPGGPPGVSILVANVTNLQQTPATAQKVMLKVFEKAKEGAEPASYMFHFTSTDDARAEADQVKGLLTQLIADSKLDDAKVPRPGASTSTGMAANGSSGTMAFASAANSKAASARLYDDSQLKNDIALQQSLMKADRGLGLLFIEALKSKAESMTDAAFNAHFWSNRLNLLRQHAIETSQQKGAYNVLAEVKPVMEPASDPNQPARMKLNITISQVKAIFDQHPLVKRIYNENVPPLGESEFWERFFLSKLYVKLKGERPTGQEKLDKVFDKYDEYENITAFSSRLLSQQVPHIIDLEGNEENQGGFRSGNRKDVEMRPKGRSDVPIPQTFNSLSAKLMHNVNPADKDPAHASGLDEDNYRQVMLRDLHRETEVSGILLNAKEQNSFSGQRETGSALAKVYAKQQPDQVLNAFQTDVKSLQGDQVGGINLHNVLDINDDSQSEDEGNHQVPAGSRASRRDAQASIFSSIRQRRAQLYGDVEDETTPLGLPADIAAKCQLAHATGVEFLGHFWRAFLSGDPDKAVELSYLVESLGRSKERINAVALEAEKARDDIMAQKKQEALDYYERTKKKPKRLNLKAIRGGKDAVMTLTEPLIKTLDKAIGEYQTALAAEGIQPSTE